MLKFIYYKFGQLPYWIPTMLDYIKNLGAVYLVAAFIGWSFNPMNWTMMQNGIGRFFLIAVFLITTIVTFVDEDKT